MMSMSLVFSNLPRGQKCFQAVNLKGSTSQVVPAQQFRRTHTRGLRTSRQVGGEGRGVHHGRRAAAVVKLRAQMGVEEDEEWRLGGGMPPAGKLFAEPSDYGSGFSTVAPVLEKRPGKVKFYNFEKGFGFITADTGEDFFVHISNVNTQNKDGLVEGEVVEFVVKESNDGRLQAFDVSSPGGGSLSPFRASGGPRGIKYNNKSNDFAEATPMEIDFQLLGQLFEIKGEEGLPEVLWYLSVFMRAVGYEDGLNGHMSTKLIKALAKLGMVSTARLVLEALPDAGLDQWGELAVAHFRMGADGIEEGLAVLQEMKELGFPPTALVYLRAVHQMTKLGQTSEAAVVLEMMERDCQQEENLFDFREQAWSKVIRGFNMEGNPAAALATIQEKEDSGLQLQTEDFCQVMACFSSSGDWTMVLELLRTMNDSGPQPDLKTYLTVMHALKQHNKWEECMAVLRQMRRRAVAKGEVSSFTQLYTVVLQLMLDQKKTREAVEVVSFIEEDRVMTDSRLADLMYTVERLNWSNEGDNSPRSTRGRGYTTPGAQLPNNPASQRRRSSFDEDEDEDGDDFYVSPSDKIQQIADKFGSNLGGSPDSDVSFKFNDGEDDEEEDWTAQFDKMFGSNFDDDGFEDDDGEDEKEKKQDPPSAVSSPEEKGWVKNMVEEWLDEEVEEEEEEEDDLWLEGDTEEPEMDFPVTNNTEENEQDDDEDADGEQEANNRLEEIKAGLGTYTVADLKGFAKELGLKGYSRLKKSELEATIRNL